MANKFVFPNSTILNSPKFNFPSFFLFNFNVTFYYKQRLECLLFLQLLFLIFFFESLIKTQFFTTKQFLPLNVLQIQIRGEAMILNFIKNINSLNYFTSINSTSKIKFAFGGIAPPAP